MKRLLITIGLVSAVAITACTDDPGTGTSAPETTAPIPTSTVGEPAATPAPTTAPTTPAPTTTFPTSTTTATTTTLPPTTSTSPPATTGPTTTLAPPEARTERVEIIVGGRDRSYILHVPEGLDGAPAPLVIDLHGLTATADRQDRVSGMRAAASRHGFVVAQPESALPANAWDTLEGSSDVGFVLAVISDVAATVPIDPERVYATGYSAGGGLTNRLACDAADVFAAVAPVAGAHVGWPMCDPNRPVPVIAFHGESDFIVPYGGFGLLPDIAEWAASWSDRNRCDPSPAATRVAADVTLLSWTGCANRADVLLYTVVDGGHGWPGTSDPAREGDTTDSIDATELIWEFFAAHPQPLRRN